MQIGMIGRGRMGASMVRGLVRAGHQCVVFDMFPKAVLLPGISSRHFWQPSLVKRSAICVAWAK